MEVSASTSQYRTMTRIMPSVDFCSARHRAAIRFELAAAPGHRHGQSRTERGEVDCLLRRMRVGQHVLGYGNPSAILFSCTAIRDPASPPQ